MAKNLTISADGKTLSGSALKALSINGNDLKTLSIDGVEVWRKEFYVVQNSAWQNGYGMRYRTGGNCRDSSSGTEVKISRRLDDTGDSWLSYYVKIPTSEYSTLKVSASWKSLLGGGGISPGSLVVLAKSVITTGGRGMLGLIRGIDNNNANGVYPVKDTFLGKGWGGEISSGSMEWDISGLNEDYYLQIGCYSYGPDSNQDGSSFKLNTVLLE